MMNSQRLYLDHNATSVLSERVDLKAMPMANPSSVHASGKLARRKMNEVRDFLYSTYSLKENEYDLFFHSGATEGINTVVKGMAFAATREKKTMTFFTLGSDHSCVANQEGFLKLLGHDFKILPVLKSGLLNEEEAIKEIKACQSEVILINWTWVNNETGVVQELSALEKLKERCFGQEVFFHVDAVQAAGKIEQWRELSSQADAYTFSGHKFGALKGSGFTFLRSNLNHCPLLNGGGQQGAKRSGTENTWGILSLKMALEDLKENYQFKAQQEAKQWFEARLKEELGDKGEIIAEDSPRNGQTIYFLFHEVAAQSAAMVFDMAGIDLSNGSACSSGAVVPSRALLAMGYNEDQAKSALRLSFSWKFNLEEAQRVWEHFSAPLKRLLS